MKALETMTLDELALLIPCTNRPIDPIIDELRRRQRMLEAAEAMQKAIGLLAYQAALTPPAEVIGLDISRCQAALVAYQSAKGDR